MEIGIKARELRLGNWVKYQISEHNEAPCYITRLDENGLGSTNIVVDKHVTGYQPIPLTQEILEKAGFRESDVEGIFVIDSLKYYYDIYVTLTDAGWNAGVSGHRASGQTASIVVAVIQYLHQLQNLYFALTGEELSITL